MASSDRMTVDAVRCFLTGAGSHNGVQADPDASTGAFQSSTRAEFLSCARGAGLSNVVLDFVGGANGPGQGVIAATGASALTWAPPGESAGDAVSIADGESQVLCGVLDGVDGKYVVARRTSGTALSGSSNAVLADQFGNALGMVAISSAEALAGVTRVRVLSLCNDHVGLHPVKALKVWLEALDGDVIDGADGAHAAVLGASGSGTIGTGLSQPGRFTGWPESGWVLIENAAGDAREIAYYTSRTSTVLTVPSAGRGLSGTSARAGASTDVLRPWCGATLSKFVVSTGATYPAAGSIIAAGTWVAAHDEDTAVDVGTLVAGAHVGIGIRWQIPAGAVATPGGWVRGLKWGFETVY